MTLEAPTGRDLAEKVSDSIGHPCNAFNVEAKRVLISWYKPPRPLRRGTR